jgi:hypothetical protein
VDVANRGEKQRYTAFESSNCHALAILGTDTVPEVSKLFIRGQSSAFMR